MAQRVAIVGAGVGGLSSAARLAKRGYAVDVYEKLDKCGGRNHLLEDKGFKFDMGPSFVLMPDLFEEAFTHCGEDIRDYLDLRCVDPNYSIFFSDGESLTVHRDTARTRDEVERLEAGGGRGFDAFLEETARLYGRLRPKMYKCFTKRDLFDLDNWKFVAGIRPLESFWHLAQRYFKTDKLCCAFTFEAMFMGVSAFEAPAFYSIITYTDHVQKIFHPMGGMYQIPLALERMAKKFGARFHYNAPVKKIRRSGSALVLELEEGEEPFDKVVVNADYAYAQEQLLGRRLPDYRYSCSVYLLYLGLKKKITGFAHHNLFFSHDIFTNLDQIFKAHAAPDDPSFYVHVPTVTDPSLAPPGKDIVYVLVPVPNLAKGKGDLTESEERIRGIVFDKISERLGERIEGLIEVEHRFFPRDFITRYNIRNGATFGLAHNLMQSAFFRPANADPGIPNLYYAGASTQPGGGLPVVLAGARIAADMITGEYQ